MAWFHFFFCTVIILWPGVLVASGNFLWVEPGKVVVVTGGTVFRLRKEKALELIRI